MLPTFIVGLSWCIMPILFRHQRKLIQQIGQLLQIRTRKCQGDSPELGRFSLIFPEVVQHSAKPIPASTCPNDTVVGPGFSRGVVKSMLISACFEGPGGNVADGDMATMSFNKGSIFMRSSPRGDMDLPMDS